MFPTKFLVIIGIVICLLVCYYFYDEINSAKKLAAQTHQKLAGLENRADTVEREVLVIQRKTEALSRWQAGEDIHSPPMTISFNSDMVPNGDLSVRYVNISDPEAIKMLNKANGRPSKVHEGRGVPAVLPTIIQASTPQGMPARGANLLMGSVPRPMPTAVPMPQPMPRPLTFNGPQQPPSSRPSMFAPAIKPISPQRQHQHQSQPLTPSRYSVPRDELSDFGSERPRRASPNNGPIRMYGSPNGLKRPYGSPSTNIEFNSGARLGSPSELPAPYRMLTPTEGSEFGHILSGLENDVSNLDTSDFDMELDQRAVRNISEAIGRTHESDTLRPQSRSKPSRK
ncbi:Hypothetical protein MVR_LOCUS191 [uncultured virus]|nr:Hypothetical protein MVR_LOCUS191 [uncultured virus]